MYGKKPLTKQNILNRISGYDIFVYYINGFNQLGKKFKSELRKDTNPTCSVKQVGLNYFLYRDFATGDSLDCFSYVQKKYNLTFIETLAKINVDFNLNLNSDIVFTPSEKTPIIHKIENLPIENYKTITVKKRKWSKLDKLFWFDSIEATSKLLEQNLIFPISCFFINNIYYKTEPVAYCYINYNEDGEEVYKIYQPFSKECKWISNYNNNTLFGNELNLKPFEKDYLIITKSLKDTVTLKLLGFNVVNPPSENSNLEKFFTRNPTYLNKSILLYDNDKAGLAYAKKQFEELGIPFYYFEEDLGVKDSFEYVKKFGKLQLKELITKVINDVERSNT